MFVVLPVPKEGSFGAFEGLLVGTVPWFVSNPANAPHLGGALLDSRRAPIG